MGIFKREKPEDNWLDEVELFANFYGDLKLDLEQLTAMVMAGDYELAEDLWERWDDHAKGCAFFYVLGALEGAYEEITKLYDEPDY